jgi:hypothetical protein
MLLLLLHLHLVDQFLTKRHLHFTLFLPCHLQPTTVLATPHTPTMDDYSTNSESDYANSWITWFLSTKGNEYFVEIDDDYLMDRFNLTGLNGELVKDYSKALDMILDNLEGEESMDEEERESLDTSARFLYGLIHARFIVTSRGLAKMVSSTFACQWLENAVRKKMSWSEKGWPLQATGPKDLCEAGRRKTAQCSQAQQGCEFQQPMEEGRPISAPYHPAECVQDAIPLLFETAVGRLSTILLPSTEHMNAVLSGGDGGRVTAFALRGHRVLSVAPATERGLLRVSWRWIATLLTAIALSGTRGLPVVHYSVVRANKEMTVPTASLSMVCIARASKLLHVRELQSFQYRQRQAEKSCVTEFLMECSRSYNLAVLTAREIPPRRFRPLSSCLLLRTISPPRRSLRHTLHKSRKTLLPAMRRRLFTQKQPSRLDRWCILWHHVPSYAIHGLPADDPGESTTAADYGTGWRSE